LTIITTKVKTGLFEWVYRTEHEKFMVSNADSDNNSDGNDVDGNDVHYDNSGRKDARLPTISKADCQYNSGKLLPVVHVINFIHKPHHLSITTFKASRKTIFFTAA